MARTTEKPHPYDELRRVFRSHWYAVLSDKRNQLKLEGKFPFEGGWYSEAEIGRRASELTRRDREIVFDLVLVFTLGTALVGLLLFILMVWVQ